MRLCQNCHTHNQDESTTCHECGYSLEVSSRLSIQTAVLLGLVGTGCIGGAIGEQEYGVPMIDNDGDGYYEYEDCDDSNPEVLGPETSYYLDSDGDGFGDPDVDWLACDEPDGYVVDNTDCDDSNAEINPDAEEVAGDGVDSNCNDNDDS